MSPAHFRVFLSSPGDVHDERTLARRVIESLPKQPFIRNRATIEVVSWDDPEALSPVYANLTPQQALQRHLKMPSACDIVVVVLWSRLGTPLPDDAFYRKPDGGRYLSGTEWEFEDAARTARPVLVYRRSETPVMAVDDPEWAAKAAQYALVKQFFQRFTNVDGSLNGLYRVYEKPSEFEHLLDTDVRAVLETLLTTRPTEPDGEADLYVTVRASTDDPWEPPQNLGPSVNTAYFEGQPTVSANGKTLYWDSSRPGGFGDFDIWMATRQNVGEPFGAAVNLGPAVNTAGPEFGAALNQNEKQLFFSSGRPGNLGQIDIWVVERQTKLDAWGIPINVDTLNSPYFQAMPAFRNNGQEVCFMSFRPGGFGGLDVWCASRLR